MEGYRSVTPGLPPTGLLGLPSGGIPDRPRNTSDSATRKALFWGDAAECAHVCLATLADETRRLGIAAAGHARSVANAHRNENVMRTILERLATNDRAGPA